MRVVGYVFVNDENGMFVGMDSSSGGYPFETTNFISAKVWDSAVNAEEYRNIFIRGDSTDSASKWVLKPVCVHEPQ